MSKTLYQRYYEDPYIKYASDIIVLFLVGGYFHEHMNVVFPVTIFYIVTLGLLYGVGSSPDAV